MLARNEATTWALDREIVLSRVLEAPRALVYEAWTKAQHLANWFCPKGFTTEQIECDVRVGGTWRFVMVAPDGKRYDNRIVFLELRAPDLLVFDHGSDKDDDPGRFRVTITFDEQRDGKTVMTMRQLLPTKEQRQAKIAFGAVEIGYGTLDNLATYLRRMT